MEKGRSLWIAIFTWVAAIFAIIAMMVTVYFSLEWKLGTSSVAPLPTDQMLAALGVIVTVLAAIVGVGAIMVGVIAVFGYRAITDEVVKKATSVATETASRVSLDSVVERAEKAAREVALREVQKSLKSYRDMDMGNRIANAESMEEQSASNKGESIADPYPGEEDTHDEHRESNSGE